jgi:hypothetical protein
MSPAAYVRSVRQQLEKEGLPTEREEFPTKISGIEFVGAVLRVPETPNSGYCRGIYTTFRSGYSLSFEVHGRGEERIKQVLVSAVKISSSLSP